MYSDQAARMRERREEEQEGLGECCLLSEKVVRLRKDRPKQRLKKGDLALKFAAIVDGEFSAWYEPMPYEGMTDEEFEQQRQDNAEDERALEAAQAKAELLRDAVSHHVD